MDDRPEWELALELDVASQGDVDLDGDLVPLDQWRAALAWITARCQRHRPPPYRCDPAGSHELAYASGLTLQELDHELLRAYGIPLAPWSDRVRAARVRTTRS